MKAALSRLFLPLTEATCPIRPVRHFRICLGLAIIVTALEAGIHLHQILPTGLLRLPVLGQGLDLPPFWLFFLCAIWALSGFSQFHPVSAQAGLWVAFPIQVFILLFDQQLYSNHLYLLALVTLLSLFIPGNSGSQRCRWWPIFLIQSQVSIAYFFAAFTKCNLFYLSGALIWNSLDKPIRELPVAPFLFEPPFIFYFAASSIALEFFLSLGLWFKKTRLFAIILGLCLHGSMMILLHPEGKLGIIAFSCICWGSYILFMKAPPEIPSG